MTIQDTLHQFVKDTPWLFKSGSHVLVACSGGPDSVALTLSLVHLKDDYPFEIQLAHVNHGLRGLASQQDETFVKKLAASLGIPLTVIKRSLQKHKTGNLEEEARVKRYEALIQIAKKTKCQIILTAHTLDDQVETVVMNLMRGTGSDGLMGIHPLRKWYGTSIFVGRPFLTVKKADVLTFLKESHASYRTDQSNKNKRFLRNWIRQALLPSLENRAPGFKKRLGHMAEILRDESLYWSHQLDDVHHAVMRSSRHGELLDFEGLLRYPPSIQRRFLRRLCGHSLSSFDGVESLRHWMNSPPTNGRVWQLKKGWKAERLSKNQGSPSSKLFLIRGKK